MNADEEYLVRNQIKDIIMCDVKKKLDCIFEKCKDDFEKMVSYPLAALEYQYIQMSTQSMEWGLDMMELLQILNPLREATYWFIHEMLKRQGHIEVTRTYFDYDKKDFGKEYCNTILEVYDLYSKGKKIGLQRSIAKVKINEVKGNTYEFLFPHVDEDYNKEMLYYYGLDDTLRSTEERNKVVKMEQYLFEKINVKKLIRFPKRLFEYLKDLDNMLQNIDAKFYRLCKARVAIDINKIADQVESEVILNKQELVKVVALFYYLSRLYMHKYMLETFAPLYIKNKRMIYCHFTMDELEKLSKQIGISRETLDRYSNYWTMDLNVEKGGFNEFPFLVFDENVIWIPSSIVLNDLQFSIVNGHYYKSINFPKHEETIAQSIVKYIVESVKPYNNILCKSNFLYSVPGQKFKGKDLQSDMDVALYDKINNVLLIIECKWKENVYGFTDDYVKVERAVNEVYKKQLDKHKYYLSLDADNYNKIFDNQINIKEKLDDLEVMYLFVDKRIQFHNQEENRHVIPTFMFSYIMKINSKENTLNLSDVIKKIQRQNSGVKYERVALKNSVVLGNKTFI